MLHIKENKEYAIKEIRQEDFDDFRCNLVEVLSFFRIPYEHQNIVALKKVYMGKEVM